MLTTNGLSHGEMAYMCSKCVWFRFVGKELWAGFYLRKEHGMHTHSFLKWETLIDFNRSSVWAGNGELSWAGDDLGFSGHFLRLPVRHQAGERTACVVLPFCVSLGPISGAGHPPTPHSTQLPTPPQPVCARLCIFGPHFLSLPSLCEPQKVCGSCMCWY